MKSSQLTQTYPSTKKCYQCGQTHPRTEKHFYPNPATGDGLTWLCIPCYDSRLANEPGAALRGIGNGAGRGVRKRQKATRWPESEKNGLSNAKRAKGATHEPIN